MPNSGRTGEPTFVLNPPSDTAFVSFVEEIRASGVTDDGALQHRLRERYPDAVVHHRGVPDERLLPEMQPVVQYVYRDGRWVSGRGASRNARGGGSRPGGSTST